MVSTIRVDLFLHAPVEHVPTVLRHVDPSRLHAGLNLTQAEVGDANGAHLPLLNQIVEGTHRFLKRSVHVWPVDHIHVHVVSIEILHALLDRGYDTLAATVTELRRFFVTDAELRHDECFLAAITEGLRQRSLRGAETIPLGGIEAVNAQVECSVHRLDELCFFDTAISAADLPAADTDSRDLHACLSEWAIFHSDSLLFVFGR